MTVLSVVLCAVPAHRLLPPSPAEGGLRVYVCVAVCHSGRTHSHEKQPTLLKACCRLFDLFLSFSLPRSRISKRSRFPPPLSLLFYFISSYLFPLVVPKRRVLADSTGDNQRKVPGDLKKKKTVGCCKYWPVLGLFVVFSLIHIVPSDFGHIYRPKRRLSFNLRLR